MIKLQPWKLQKFPRYAKRFWWCPKCYAGPFTGKQVTIHKKGGCKK